MKFDYPLTLLWYVLMLTLSLKLSHLITIIELNLQAHVFTFVLNSMNLMAGFVCQLIPD